MSSSDTYSSSDDSESYTFATAPHTNDTDGIVLNFSDVKAWVSNLKVTGADGEMKTIKRRDILRGVTGTVRSGEMTMLMGASGAGKSTLLDVLASRATSIESSGNITLNGEPFGLAEFQAVSAYVTQDAVFLNSLTPRNVLMFKAKMVLPTSLSAAEKRERVDSVIALLGLEDVQDVQMGEPGVSARGLNFVQRKLLNVAASLLSNPRVLFVDEPTTGLDAAAARKIVHSLRRVSRERSIVVFATLHQPSVTVFNMFEKALVMAIGQIAYEGPVSGVIPFLASAGYPCPAFKNPADHVIQVLDSRDGDTGRVQAIIDEAEQFADKRPVPAPIVVSEAESARAGWFRQQYLLTMRSLLVILKSAKGFFAGIGQSIGFAVLIGLLYQLDEDQAGAQDRVGLLFLTCTNALFLATQGATMVLIEERAVLLREVADGMYSMPSYALSKILSSIPLAALYQAIFSVIMYWWAGLDSDFDSFLIFYLVQFIVGCIGANIGLTIGAFTGDAATATALTPVVIVPSMILSGVLVAKETIPIWLRWLREVSILRFAFSALLLNEAKDKLVFSCTAAEATAAGVCPIPNGNVLVSSRDADDGPGLLWFRFVMLAAFYVFTVLTACAGLLFSVRNNKKTTNTAKN